MAGHDAGVSLRVVRKALNTHAPAAVQGGKDLQAVDLADDAEQRRQVGKGAVFETLLLHSGGSVCDRGIVGFGHVSSLQNSLGVSTKTPNRPLRYEANAVDKSE
jgi:hypothetical protein